MGGYYYTETDSQGRTTAYFWVPEGASPASSSNNPANAVSYAAQAGIVEASAADANVTTIVQPQRPVQLEVPRPAAVADANATTIVQPQTPLQLAVPLPAAVADVTTINRDQTMGGYYYTETDSQGRTTAYFWVPEGASPASSPNNPANAVSYAAQAAAVPWNGMGIAPAGIASADANVTRILQPGLQALGIVQPPATAGPATGKQTTVAAGVLTAAVVAAKFLL